MIRIPLWWSVFVGCLIAMIQASGSLSRFGVIGLVICGSLAAIVAAIEHGWYRAPYRIGTPLRTILLILICCAPLTAVGWYVWPSQDGMAAAQVSVTKIVGVFMVNQKTEQQGFGLNVYYRNSGAVTIPSVSHRAFVYTSAPTSPPDANQIGQFQGIARQVKPPIPGDASAELERNGSELFFTYPNPDDGDDAMVKMASAARQVLAGQLRMYVFVAFKYSDTSLPSGTVRLTETCRWAEGNFEAWHFCGVNRTTVVDAMP